MFKGVIEVTSDPNYLATKAGYTVLMLGEYEDLYVPMMDTMSASILLPPYVETMLQMDGMLQEFEQRYIAYLNSPELRRYLSMIFLGMIRGMNFIMYVGRDEAQLPFYYTLLNHFLVYYGIAIGEFNKTFAYDINNPNVILLLYEQNLVTPNAFLSYYPRNMMIPEPIAYKLACDYGTVTPGVPPSYYAQNYTNMRNQVQSGPVKVNTPMQIVDKEGI